MLLGCKTDSPIAELSLCSSEGAIVDQLTWQADRQLAHGLLEQITIFLSGHELSIHDLTGLFVFRGPGSFTGLRIGITTMNTLAYALDVPVVGEMGDAWRETATGRLAKGQNDKVILPFYGAEARITQPKK
jgi:tRNA threonylcarbamoyladenosine biosynthesis protein TsaB